MSVATAETVRAPGLDRGEATGFRPGLTGWVARLAVFVLIFGGIIWITATVPQFWADRISLAVIFAIIGLSLNIVMGYIGQVSLGHHAFVGIAAFVAAYYVSEQAGCSPEGGCSMGAFLTATALAVVSGGLGAGLLGVVALRIQGLYLALITLAYGVVAETSIFEIPSLTRGGAGMPAPRPDGFTTDRAFAYLCFVALALVIFVDWRLLRSKVGRAILSIKNSEPVASSYGISVTSFKILAFVLSGVFAGLAGSLFAFRSTNVVSNDFIFANALLWVLMVVVGGLGNRIGVIIGSAFFALFPFLIELWGWLDHFIIDTLKRAPGHVTLMIGALLALFTIVLHPGGIAEQVSPITRWLGGKRFSLHPDDGHAPAKQKAPLMSRLGIHKESDTEALARLSGDGNGRSGESAPTTVGAPPVRSGESPGNGSTSFSVDPPDVWGNLTGKDSEER